MLQPGGDIPIQGDGIEACGDLDILLGDQVTQAIHQHEMALANAVGPYLDGYQPERFVGIEQKPLTCGGAGACISALDHVLTAPPRSVLAGGR